jgi:hypothetical protein
VVLVQTPEVVNKNQYREETLLVPISASSSLGEILFSGIGFIIKETAVRIPAKTK